jgi:hypothetical protein
MTKPKVEEPSACAGEGRPRVRVRLAEGKAPAMRVDELDHFEVRTYLGLKRHLILSRVSLHFLQQETNRRRGKKTVVESGAGASGRGSTTRSGSVAA